MPHAASRFRVMPRRTRPSAGHRQHRQHRPVYNIYDSLLSENDDEQGAVREHGVMDSRPRCNNYFGVMN